DHVKQQENNKENHRQNNLQSLLRPQLKFVFPGPVIGISRRHVQLVSQHTAGLVHKPAVISSVEVEIYIAGKGAVLVTNHGRSVRKRQVCNLSNGNLRSPWSGNKHSFKVLP